MNHPDYDYMIVMERRRDQLAEAKRSRLVREALGPRRHGAGYALAMRLNRAGERLMLSLAQFLSAAGGWLLNLSCRLQTRSALLNQSAADPQATPCAEAAA